jgi:transcriptional regulator with XRE-family HTH domain
LPKSNKPPPDDPSAALDADRERAERALISVLRAARYDADLTQRQLAAKLGLTEDIVSNIEAGRTPISFADAVLWATRTNLDEAEFFEHWLFRAGKRKPQKR